MTTVPEPLNCETWLADFQEAVYSELSTLLNKPAPIDYATMTDEELAAALRAVYTEMSTRPTATTSVLDAVVFGSDTIFLTRTT